MAKLRESTPHSAAPLIQVNTDMFHNGNLRLSGKESDMRMRMLAVIGAAASALAAGSAVAADGKAVWEKSCAGCHAMLAPKFGDKAAWAPFVKLGTEQATANVMKAKVRSS